MTRTNITDAPNLLRHAGLTVVEHPGWQARGTAFTDCHALVWHHDASAKGDSPGVPGFMAREIDAGRPGAQLWVNSYGVWTVVAHGRVSHAGAVLPGMPSNSYSAGIETDHTTGEDWPPALLASLRLGTSVLLKAWGLTTSSGLHFHKSICKPVGRKSDPDGLTLATERANVTKLIKGPAKPPAKPKLVPGAPAFTVSRPGKMIPAHQADAGNVQAPPFPLPRGSYFGPRTGPAESVSGYSSHREDLKRWQAQMAKRGWKITADGLWGAESHTVAAQFQREKGLKVDGLVGPTTWTASWSTPVA